jgi:hypothetical protein
MPGTTAVVLDDLSTTAIKSVKFDERSGESGIPLFVSPRCRGRVPIVIAMEVNAVALIVLTVGTLMPFAALAGPFSLWEVRDCVGPGRGRHRRIVRGRHAARGGRR